MIGKSQLIAPIQARGTFQSERRDHRIRIATRGPFNQSLLLDEDVSLASLVAQLRSDRELPLTVVISGAGWSAEGEGDRFIGALLKCINRRIDAIWLIAPQLVTWNPPTGDLGSNVVTLSLATPLDSRIADNLIADVLFLPATDLADNELLRRLRGRVLFVVLPRMGPHRDKIASLAYDAGAALLHWDSDTRKIGRDATPNLRYAPGDAAPASVEGIDLDGIGKHLAELARVLGGRREKRSAFRNALAELGSRYGTRPRWEESLLRLANEHKWPRWAVQTLPSLYLRTSADDVSEISAFVWRPLTEWMEAPEQYLDGLRKFCNDEMWQMRLPGEIASVLSEIHAQINENLRGNPLHGDGVFFGRISDAVDAVAQVKKNAGDPIAARLQTLSRALRLMV